MNYEWLVGVMQRGAYDAIVHLAAKKAAGESMLVPEKYATQNISGTINMLNAACATGIKRSFFFFCGGLW